MSGSTLNHTQVLESTKRLNLRALQVKDAEVVFYYRNQPEVSLFQGWTPQTPAEISSYAKEMLSRAPGEPGYWYQVVIELRQNNVLEENPIIGDVAFNIEAEHKKQAELGIALSTEYQKKGYAQEALRGLIEFLFETYDLHRIHVSIDPANSASRQLFERLGFRLEGHLVSAVFFKGEWCDDIIMAILKTEWYAQNK